MMGWFWRLGLIALLTWVSVPLLMREDAPDTPTETLGAEVVDSALVVWQRFWAERTPSQNTPQENMPGLPASVGAMPKVLEAWLVEQQQDSNFVLQVWSLIPQGQSLNVFQLQERAQAMGIPLEEQDAEQLLAWLQVQRP